MQRACACEQSGALCPECARKKALQRRAAPGATHGAVPPAVYATLRQAGRPLDTETRTFMEAQLGHDLAGVRVHTDAAAARSARAVDAHAYTVGRHVVFSEGAYDPRSRTGRRLLAHELTHVLQQGPVEPAHGLALGSPHDASEHEAERVAERVSAPARDAAPAPLPVGGMPATVSRQHLPGGPYHPPEGTELACSMDDDCSSLSTKINYLRHTIRRHQEWDAANPDPRYPGGRHAIEIADLIRALENCTRIANTKCTNQPEWVPAEQPQEDPQARRERVERQLYEALPWAVAVIVIGLVIACVVVEPCGAAVLAALAAALGAEELAIVLGILGANGVRMAT